MSQKSTVADKAKALILAQGGLIRTREAISLGIHPRHRFTLFVTAVSLKSFLEGFTNSKGGSSSNILILSPLH